MKPKYEIENNGVYAKMINLGNNNINASSGHEFSTRENDAVKNFFYSKLNNSLVKEVLSQVRSNEDVTRTIPLNLTSEIDGPVRVGVYARKGKFNMVMSNAFETGDSFKKSVALFKQLVGLSPPKKL